MRIVFYFYDGTIVPYTLTTNNRRISADEIFVKKAIAEYHFKSKITTVGITSLED